MDYAELSVQIYPGDPGKYRVRVASDQGQGEGELVLPFAVDDLYGVVHGVEPTDPNAPATPPTAPPGAETDFGRKLFQALFNGQARDILSRTQSAARDAGGPGMRIRLSMNLTDPGMADVACLPWELMCGDDDLPFATSRRSVVVRSIDTPQPIAPPPIKGALRILALKSNPDGTPPLDLDKEVTADEASWARIPGLQVDFVRPARSVILDRLAATDYHVVHYMGHGGFNPQAGGRLLLENDDGTLQRVPAKDFAAWLRDQPLRLVFLNACETGRTPGSADLPPFSGVAAALIHAGIPAVVGNQFSVSDWGATTFSDTFYRRIVQGFPVDAAVAEGRKALYAASPPVQWATPVLYMRTRNGDLFPSAVAVQPATPTDATPDLPPPPRPQEPAMPEPSNRGISIGGAVTGSVVQTGDHNVTNLSYTHTTLPPPESVDIAAVLEELRALTAQIALPPKKAAQVNNQLDQAKLEVTPDPNDDTPPDKSSVATYLHNAISAVKDAEDFASKAAPIAKLVVSAAGWLGGGLAGPLLSLVGLTL